MYYPEFEQAKPIIPMMEPDTEHDSKKIAKWDDARNIQVGKATVIYVPERSTYPLQPAFWALPGGRRVSDYETAHAMAARMNMIMCAATDGEFTSAYRMALFDFEKAGV